MQQENELSDKSGRLGMPEFPETPEPPQTTAIVKVKPEEDASFVALHNEVQGLQGYAMSRFIASIADVKNATDDLSLIANVKKAIEAKRREYIDPLNAHINQINSVFKMLTGPLSDADKATRDKILAWRQEQDRLRHEAEEIARLEAEAADRRAKLAQDKGEPKPETEVLPMPEAPPAPPSRVHTEMGTLSTMDVRKWEVEDMSKVPDDYKIVNVAQVTKMVKAGIPSIPGIRIWVEETLRVNTRKE